ncbi:MAG TPA: HD domain-containing phosphohydrolase [Anaerolineaceae bacterium]|nr:HD domain-containing phosphohydrolase [Anaerolineaceae bacterium]
MSVAGYYHRSIRTIPIDDEGAMGTITQGSAPAFERARQSGEGKENNLFTGLIALSHQLNTASDLERALDTAARIVVEQLNISHASILLLQEDGFFVRKTEFCHPDQGENGLASRLESVAAQLVYHRVMHRQEPLVISGKTAHQRLAESQVFGLTGYQTLCLLPLRDRHDPVGIFVLGELREGMRNPFHDWNLHLASMVAQQASTAIQRLRTQHEAEIYPSEVVEAMMRVIEAGDGETGLHSERLVHLSQLLCQALGHTHEEVQVLAWAAELHDIGKISVPREILHRPGPLNASEWEIIKRHPAVGANILASMPGLGAVAEIVRYHHENYDGTGYPDRLQGEQIPLGARMLAVIDSFVAMTEGRAYQAARTSEEALEELVACAGSKYDPSIVEAFVTLINSGNVFHTV